MEIPVNSSLGRHLGRYTLAVVVVAGALLLRSLVVYGLGLQLPLFILLYPAVMLVAISEGGKSDHSKFAALGSDRATGTKPPLY